VDTETGLSNEGRHPPGDCKNVQAAHYINLVSLHASKSHENSLKVISKVLTCSNKATITVAHSIHKLRCGLEDQGSVPSGDNDGVPSLGYCIQTGSVANPASYPVAIESSFLGGKAAGV
jgi:hypothetical protein